jgi:acyl-CoA reductase-like NAD-dependent aldehyde dehydrogenase
MALMSKAPDRALIGGEWVEGSAGTFEVRSPHSREVINTVARCDSSDVDRAVAAARRAQPAWAGMPLIDRTKILRKITEVFRDNA